jgi:crotonobetainyl-CoA:carnitine CoA-transferase CaiB-like acyl-CoA transferase
MEFRSERYMSLDGAPPPELWDALSGAYRCGDGRWVRVHANFPHHRDGVLRLLGCPGERAVLQAALQGWQAEAFETAAAEAGLVVAMLRGADEWAVHPQGQAVAALPLFTIEQIGAAAPRPLGEAARPLGGLRVLDLTRIIAGPVCGRALAAHGAEVLRVTAGHLPSVAPLVIDTGRGKRSAEIDLRDPAGAATLRALIAEADVFVQGYRPGALAKLGFAPEAAAALRPGLVAVSLSAYGHAGPWAERRGFDSLVQTATGLNALEAEAAGQDRPKPLPCQALDHASGYLMAFGAMAGLLRQAEQGGSWHVRVSLAQTGRWLESLGRVEGGLETPDPGLDQVADLLEETESGFGKLTALRHAAQLSATPAHWARPAMPLGSHPPVWDRAAST